MRHVETKIDNFNIIYEKFDNYTEFTNIVADRPTLWTGEDVPCHDVVGASYFRGCSSYEEAKNMLLYGTDEGLSRMRSRVGELQKQGVRMKRRHFNDVVGYTPIVANALLGIPEAMVNCERKPVASKVITIVYDCAVSGGTPKERVLEFGCKFVNAVMNLEESGVRVRIDYLKSNIEDNRIYCYRVPVKNEHQPINLKRLMFPLTHAAMQRYLSWEWQETLPNSTYMSGYGHSLYGADSREKNTILKLLDKNEYLIHYNGGDIDSILKQIDMN